ncbi:MAG: inner membrane CreD family protein, partial [Solimonas sp.]
MTADTPNPPPLPGTATPRWLWLQTPAGRLLLIGLLFVLLQVPLHMIEGLAQERQGRRDMAMTEVAATWGGRQNIIGPLLRLPYRDIDSSGAWKSEQARYAYVLPAQLEIDAEVRGMLRRRGLFEAPVYTADLALAGRFRRPDLSALVPDAQAIDWVHAALIVGVSDPRALHADGSVAWNGAVQALRPSTGDDAELALAGLHVPLDLSGAGAFRDGEASFDIRLSLGGAAGLDFAPLGEQTVAKLRSDWTSPSFQGAWLPVRNAVRSDGFDADWSISYLGRS